VTAGRASIPDPRGEARLGPETFRFFRDLARNNRTAWMETHRERYQRHVIAPLRTLLADLTPAVLSLHPDFETSGRTGANFSRINRDTRFAKDKRPYRTRMYLRFSRPLVGDDDGELYVGVSAQDVTAGFRIYGGRRDSTLAQVGRARAGTGRTWLARQKRRLGPRYDSYWYRTEKGAWTKHDGFPVAAEDWARLQGLVVRRQFSTRAAAEKAFPKDVMRVFRDLFPVYRFTSVSDFEA
jgi:uncharacterized protein (TIGR02453 family)